VITSIELVQSSGDAVLDRSARVALLKSSPLPVPQEAALFDQFRSLRIKMSPQEIKGMS
jgi:outer membrane biosynthesis protein TonB